MWLSCTGRWAGSSTLRRFNLRLILPQQQSRLLTPKNGTPGHFSVTHFVKMWLHDCLISIKWLLKKSLLKKNNHRPLWNFTLKNSKTTSVSPVEYTLFYTGLSALLLSVNPVDCISHRWAACTSIKAYLQVS